VDLSNLNYETNRRIIHLANAADGVASRTGIDILTNNQAGFQVGVSNFLGGTVLQKSKLALTYENGGFLKGYLNGVKLGEVPNIATDDKSVIRLGSRLAGQNQFQDHIKAVALLPTAITEAEAIALTS
jgi:hypothetical protein